MDVPWKMVEHDEKSPRSHGESPKSQVQFPQQSPTSISAAEWWSNRDTWQWRVCCGFHIFHMLYFMYGHTEMYFMICYMLYPCIYVLPNMLCMRIYIYIYHNISYVYIYMYICNTTHTWIHLNLSMYGRCGCGWHNHPGTKCVKLCTGIEERICIYSFHLDANSIRTKICMVYCQHAVGGTDHRALSSFYPMQVAWLGGWMVFAHCWWYIPAIVGGYWLVTSPLYSHYIPNTTYYPENCHDNCHNN